MLEVLMLGEQNRHINSTRSNQKSSRSHSICIIEILQRYSNDSVRRGVINLVDLAGSERVSKSYATGRALEEAKKINASLSTLGKVISSIAKNLPHVPFRDSKLTRVLKESLGGNNKTTLIVNCSMHHSQIEETLSTIRFAQSAKLIQNKVSQNFKSSIVGQSQLNEANEKLSNMVNLLKSELRSTKLELDRVSQYNSIVQPTTAGGSSYPNTGLLKNSLNFLN